MSKILVLAEKPSVGRDIARVLKCNKKANGYLEGQKYIVTWALGHLVTLAEPEDYDKKYKSWRIEDLPMLPSDLKLEVIRQSGRQYNTVKQQMYRKDVTDIVIATDAGREGELVARWIIKKANVRKPLKRLWISSVTDKAIRDGFNKLRDGRDYERLYAAAVARAEADWIVGINATRALTCKYNAQLSCGRVQSPTLAMIAQREEEIQNFKPRSFYGIIAMTKNLKLSWQDSRTKDHKTFDKAKCDKILGEIKNKDAKITGIDKVYKKTNSPQLYDLTELQRDANRIFGFSAKETLSIMQRLYENHKLLTYPRTDSRFLTADIVPTLNDRIKACGVGPYRSAAYKILNTSIKSNKRFVDNSKVTDHHAIIPTEQSVFLDSLSDAERKIYDLVVKRFLAVLFPPFEYEQITLRAKIGEEDFTARGKTVISMGWKEVYGEYDEASSEEDLKDEVSDQVLPKLKKGDILDITTLTQTRGETRPPAPFNEGTLLSAMENPVKYMPKDNKDLIRIIGKTGGIGTVATRADIIEKLFNSFLIEKRGKDIFITSKGKQLLELVPEDLKSPALTAEWEQKLNSIEKGVLDKDKFVNEMKEYTKTIVREIKNSTEVFKHDNITRSRCPECGKYMLEVNGKRGKLLICQDRKCGYRENISKTTNARCPNCHKRLELQGQGEGQIFVCKCGYREKLSAFNERIKGKQKNQASKRDVAKFLRDQKKKNDSNVNPAMAEALSKLKLK